MNWTQLCSNKCLAVSKGGCAGEGAKGFAALAHMARTPGSQNCWRKNFMHLELEQGAHQLGGQACQIWTPLISPL
jgi:hypothetical protein